MLRRFEKWIDGASRFPTASIVARPRKFTLGKPTYGNGGPYGDDSKGTADQQKPRLPIAREAGLLPQPIRNLAMRIMGEGGYPGLKKSRRFRGSGRIASDASATPGKK